MSDSSEQDAGSEPRGLPEHRSPFWRDPVAATLAATVVTAMATIIVAVISNSGGNDSPDPARDRTSDNDSARPARTATSTPLQSVVFENESGTVSVAARFDVANDPRSSEQYLMPAGSLAPQGWPNQETSLFDVAIQSGGVPLGSRSVTLVIRSQEADPVLVTSIRPTVVSRNTVADGYAVVNVYGCGGQALRTATADLDTDPVSVTYTTGEGAGGSKPRRNLLLEVSPSDPEVVSVVGRARKFDVAYNIEVDLEIGGGAETITVDDAGAPFHVTGVDPSIETWLYNPMRGLENVPGVSPFGGC